MTPHPILRVLPSRIRLEASSYCQLRCPSCPTTSRAIHPAVGSGFLKLSDFKTLLDDNPHLVEIELSNYGEKPARDEIPCTTCEIYLGMRAGKRWLRIDVRPRPSAGA